MKTLVIYDNNGVIIKQITGFYQIPNGLPYIEIEIPQGKFVVSVNVETGEPIYKDTPKSEVEVLEDKISTLEAENSKLLLDSAIKTNEINTLNKNTANLTLEIAKMKGGM